MTKICSKCGIEKKISEFHKRGNGGIASRCKSCRKEDSQEYYQNNKEKINQKNRKYYSNNSEKEKDRKKKYYQENKEERLLYNSNYYRKNKDLVFKGNKRRYKKYKQNPSYKLKTNVSRAIRRALKRGKGGNSTTKFLPYSILKLKEHLESQFDPWMNWENYGVYKIGAKKTWHIDHIIPQSKLPYDSMEHPNFQKCWSLENLRPLEAVENMKRGNKLNA